MAATALWMRSNLRAHWRSAALVVAIAALCGGAAMASVAAARRTTTSYVRFLAASRDPQVYVFAPDAATANLAAEVASRSVGSDEVLQVVFLVANPTTLDRRDENHLAVVGSLIDTVNPKVGVPKIVAGGLPDGPRDVALNEVAASTLGVTPGDTLDMVGYSPARFELCSTDPSQCQTDVDLGKVDVVGILRLPDDISPESYGSLSIELSPALTRSWLPLVATSGWITGAHVDDSEARRALGVALTDAIGADRVNGGDVFLETDSTGDPVRVRGALDVERNGLLILALLAGLAGLVAVPQALARQRDLASDDEDRLRALGWTQRDRMRAGTVWSLVIGSAGALAAIASAIAISPLFPIGLARTAEPSPGVHADWLVLATGGTITLVLMVGIGLAQSARRRSVAPADHAGRLGRLFGASRVVPATAGRFLLDRGRLAPAARTALSAAALGVAVIACATTVVRSQDHLVSRPALYGATWDLQGSLYAAVPDQAALDALDNDAGVQASAMLTGGRILVGGVETAATGIGAFKGSIEPTVLAGRAVRNDGEMVLSPGLADDIGVQVGESVAVGSGQTTGSSTVVGLGVPIAIGQFAGDTGVSITEADFRRYGFTSEIDGEGGREIAVRATPGADLRAVEALLANVTGGFDRVIAESFRPARIMNIARVRSVPQIIVGLTALLMVFVLAHSLATVASRRRHDLSVLRALGMRPGQARHVMWWNGALLAMIAAVIGLPLGVIAGRVTWHAITNSIDSVFSPQIPWTALAVLGAGQLAVAVAIGAASARRAVPDSIALTLRSE
jgi:putative ABC transport system permease protein